MPNRKQKQGLNDGHYLEMLDRLHVQMSVLEEHLIKHPVAEKHEELQKSIIEAVISLVHAYQLTGGLMVKTKKKDK